MYLELWIKLRLTTSVLRIEFGLPTCKAACIFSAQLVVVWLLAFGRLLPQGSVWGSNVGSLLIHCS